MAHHFVLIAYLLVGSFKSDSYSLPNHLLSVKPRITCADPQCDKLTITIDGAGRELKLHLAKNNYLFTPEYKAETTRSLGNNLVDCHYQLDSGDDDDGFAAMSICNNQINGMFRDASGTLFELSFDQNSNSTVLRELKKSDSIATCGVKDSMMTKLPTMYDPDYRTSQEFPNAFVKLLLVNDFTVYKQHFNSDIQSLTYYNHLLINMMNALYAPLRIHIILSGIETWKTKNEIDRGINISYTLVNFADFSSRNYASRHDYDMTILNFGHNFGTATAGVANFRTVCTGIPSAVVGAITYLNIQGQARSVTEAALVATHEAGHVLGFDHVPETCVCSTHRRGHCVMSPATDGNPTNEWSGCTKSRLREIYGSGLNQCLLKKPSDPIHALAICGNGVLESGEECDCAHGEANCRSCCDVTKCKLLPASKCASGECCSNCQLNTKGTQCASPGINLQCNLPSTCDGFSSSCPLNTPRPDLTTCTERTYPGNCYKGTCLSRGGRCFDIWGNLVTASSNEKYNSNIDGSSKGHCGKDTSHTPPCQQEDVLCGQMKCDANDFKRDKVALEQTAVRRGGFQWWGVPIGGDSTRVTLSVTFVNNNFHRTPEGMQCGDAKICSKVKCMAIGCQEDCNGQGKCVDGQCACNPGYDGPFCSKRCPRDCNRHGICNKDGTCDCLEGFSPPSCLGKDDIINPSSDQPPTDESSSPKDPPEPVKGDDTSPTRKIVVVVAILIGILIVIAGIGFYVKTNNSKRSKSVRKISKGRR